MDRKAIGISAALASAASWAAGAILFNRIGEEMSSLAMTLTKGAVSVVLLGAALALVGGSRSRRTPAPGAGLGSMDRRSITLLVASGLLGISLADTCFFEALKTLGPHSVVLLMMVGQVLTPLCAMVFLKEPSTVSRWSGIILVVAGIGIVLSGRLAGEGDLGWRGVGFGLTSVIAMSLSIVIAKKALDRLSALEGTFIRMAAGTAGMLLLGVLTGRLGAWVLPLQDPRFLLLFLVAVCIVTFGGFWLSLAAIKYADVVVGSTLISTEPLFVLLIGALFMGRGITARALAGTVLALAGVVALVRWDPVRRADLPAAAAAAGEGGEGGAS